MEIVKSSWESLRAMAPFSLQEAAVWTLPVVGAWIVMKFEVRPFLPPVA